MSFDYTSVDYNKHYEKLRDMRYALSLCRSAPYVVEIIKELDTAIRRAHGQQPGAHPYPLHEIDPVFEKLKAVMIGY